MSLTYYKGIIGEFIAIFLLKIKGYKILSVRDKTKEGEIDIVAVKGKILAFIEVKFRRTESYLKEAITLNKKVRTVNAANFYMEKINNENLNVRFDVILISWHSIKHIENAFS